ncbi:MAG TPA: uracil-DNA glycosylase, partial [Deinococcales bacterium]|nr:uracil-DNA glycosylase [Deinococcales bacterium]
WLEHVGARKGAHPFSHGAEHDLGRGPVLLDSFHVSRQNTNTGKLTRPMFDAVLARARELGA